MSIESRSPIVRNETEAKARIAELKAQIERSKRRISELKTEGASKLETDPRLKEKFEKLEKEKAELEERERRKKEKEKKEKADLEMEVQVAIGGLDPKSFVELTPKRHFFRPSFMKYINGSQYMALMTSERLSEDEKKRATTARFQFCYDWLESDDMQKYYREKKEYDEAFELWEKECKKNPYAPAPKAVEKGAPDLPVKTPLGKIVYEKFRNGLRTMKEIELIHLYKPEIFDRPEFMQIIRMGMIGEIRKNEHFGESRGRHIREMKVDDFLDVVKVLEKRAIFGDGSVMSSVRYFDSFPNQILNELRKRMYGAMYGKGRTEVAGIGSRAWKSPITMDLMNQTFLRGFKDSDEGDKRIIARHLIAALASGKMSSANEDALRWLRRFKSGHDFFVLTDDIVMEIAEDMGIDYESIRGPMEDASESGFKYGDK